MPKERTRFLCSSCGAIYAKWQGRCTQCGEWNTISEAVSERVSPGGTISALRPVSLAEALSTGHEQRVSSEIPEFDRVLGGGFVPGSLVLIGGDPGIGKSTLMLHAALNLGSQEQEVLYWSGEESVHQIQLRARRLGRVSEGIWVVAESSLDNLESLLDEKNPAFLVIDSIQTVFHSDSGSSIGSPSQVREITALLMRLAKTRGLTVIIIGHVTKEGNIAGPRMLEHMVDAVLYFEGERQHSYRILRAVKNRYGSTNEIGVFTMTEDGLQEVPNPSQLFLAERSQHGPGSTVTALVEGTRPLLVEIQALVAQTTFQNPRRLANGFDANRLAMLLAVLEKRLGLQIGFTDAYINVAGGIKVSEPAVDLAVALALWSSFRDKPLDRQTLVLGEVGLTGEVRGVQHLERRLREAAKLGFKRAILPQRQATQPMPGIELAGVTHLAEACEAAVSG
ncbi:MAG: DNA repair protein RadA [Symbiobacteriaceae bacterium]|nr:DNA repair protein RadA [Symbiobacteriaceae bacterium]